MSTDFQGLSPLPYHEAIRDFLKTEESELWDWYVSHQVRNDQSEAIKFELLKSTYRLETESQPRLYQMVEEVAERLALDIPITIYQAQNPSGLNASLAFLPDEGHIVLHGQVGSRLTDGELRALFGHELSHLMLWQSWDGEFLATDQILSALTHDRRAEAPHFETARLYGLYNEIFCDRGSLRVVDDPMVVVSMLVKVLTELQEVDPESYMRQADEIIAKNSVGSDELTHPEAFIRARAIKLWSENQAADEDEIAQMIEGEPVLEQLDLLAQRKLSALTRRLIDVMLAPAWMQTDPVLAHARLFFDDYAPPSAGHSDVSLQDELLKRDKPLRDYYCYLLLDFVTADRDLEELPLAASLVITDSCGLKERFREIARKELKLRKRQFDKIDKQKHELLARAAQESSTP